MRLNFDPGFIILNSQTQPSQSMKYLEMLVTPILLKQGNVSYINVIALATLIQGYSRIQLVL